MKYLMLSVIGCLALFLASCGTPQAASGQSVPSVSPGEEDSSAPFSVRLVTNPYGPDSDVESTGGYYRFVSSSTDPTLGGNLLYTDFALSAEIALCSRPECSHSDESCTSWLPFLGAMLFLNEDETKLFCIGYTTEGEELWRMNRDGSEKSLLYQCRSGEAFAGAVASDGEALYLTVTAVGGMDRLDEAKTVLRLDGITGMCEPFLTLDANDWVQGAFDDFLVLKSVEPETVRYALHSITTGQETEIFSHDTQNVSLPEGAFLYVLAKTGEEEADVLCVDLRTGETRTLCTGFPFFGEVSIDDILDGKLCVSIFDTRADDPALVRQYRYWVDCETGEVTENSLIYPWGEITQFVRVLAEYQDSFFVQRGVEYTPIMLTGTDGTAYETTSEAPVYAMISKSDYFANNPAYQDVATAVPGT